MKMNFSHVNFSPTSFISMHQFNTGSKVVGSVQQNITFIPATATQHYQNQSNHVNFPNNVQGNSGAVGVQHHHHYEEAVSRNLNQNGLIRQPNSTATATTAAQTPWTNNINRLPIDNIKIHLPTFLPQQIQSTGRNPTTQPVQKSSRTVEMHSVSTMTDGHLNTHNKTMQKESVISEESNDSLKSSVEGNSFQKSVCSNSCSKVHLQGCASAMAEYLSRLHHSQIPPNIEEFLKKNYIKVNANKPESSFASQDCEAEESSKCSSEAGLRLTTGLEGSLLYSCSECQLAYENKDLLERHLSVHKVERRFECNVCGVCLKRKEHLDQHKRGHSEERPFVCEICCKGFKRNEHLRRHIVIHSGDKNHVCTQCGKAFSRKDHLSKHFQTHVNKQAKSEVDDHISPLLPVQRSDSQKNLEHSFSSKQNLN